MNKKLFKNWKKILLIFGILIVVMFLIFVVIGLFHGSKNDNNKFKDEYEKLNDVVVIDEKKYPSVNISDNNKMIYVSYDDVIDIFNNGGNEVIYIGYPKCLYCRTVAQVLTDTVKDMEIDEIYYLDVEEKKDGYAELLKVLGDEFFVEGRVKDKIYVPSVLFVVNGKIVSYNKGTLFSQEDPYDELDQSQIDGLSRIYRNGINDVVDSIKIKNGINYNDENS